MSPLTSLRERDGRQRRTPCVGDRRSTGHATLFSSGAGEDQTLDDVLDRAWTGLLAGGVVTCPLCEGSMQPRWTAGAGVVGGRCRSCGTELA